MRAHSDDPRRRALAGLDGGAAPKDAAARFAVSVSRGRRLRRRRRETGETAPRPAGRRPRRPAAPAATPAELKARRGPAVGPATPRRAGAALGLTLKEGRPGRPSRTARA